MQSDGRYAFVERGSEAAGWIPTEILAFKELKGDNMGEQIE